MIEVSAAPMPTAADAPASPPHAGTTTTAPRRLRAALRLLAGLAGIAIEIASITFFADLSNSTRQLLYFLGLHFLSSALLAASFTELLPPKYRSPRATASGLIFCFAFFIPLLGALGLLLAVLFAVVLPKISAYRPFGEVAPPEYVLSIREPEAQIRISSLRSMLLDQTVPADLRVRTLNALANMPTRVAAPTLHRLLGDPVDELRLIAYGMLDQKEKNINAQIGMERAALESITDGAARLAALRHLAELHWELVYSDLVRGDVRAYTLEQALDYIDKALAIDSDGPGLWFLRGRALHAMGRMEEAREAYSLAVANGLLESRVLPYLAEIAFAQRDFTGLRQYIALVAQTQVTPAMAPIIRFWTAPGSKAAA